MSQELKSQLESKGWYLSDEGLADIQENLENEQPNVEDIIKEALNTDLRQVGRGILPRDVSEKKEITGPLVLQLLSIINLSTPLQNQQTTPRLFQLTFTDGAKKIKGIEIFGHVEKVSLNTPPGTKFLVIKNISIHENLLFLGPGMLEFLGGEVEEMIKEWKVGRQFITRRPTTSAKQGEGAVKDDEGPPPFIPFKIKNSDHQMSQHGNHGQFNESIKLNNKDRNDQFNNKRGQNQNNHQNSRRHNQNNKSNRGRGHNRGRGEDHFNNSHQVRDRNQSYNDDVSTNNGQYRGRGDQHHGNSSQQNMGANRGHYRGHYRGRYRGHNSGHNNGMYGWGRDDN
ncbi:13622_t:CDS:2 [Gigaspora margarita]|uniref:13622_t:CDS:1 n=1 Tax=Gigaspora margarita TaxID=4874 RepID=A0ABN7W0K2_GIGMA|nr:13622_t:CDS:2 [Gigaspora margarita]